MSIFEDLLEVHYNAENQTVQRWDIEALKTALDEVARPPEDVAIILDWDSLVYIADTIDEQLEYDDVVPHEHAEFRPDKIGMALDVRSTIHGVGSDTDFGLVMDPSAVRYDNTIADQSGVVAIEFTRG
jgi:hypothetical protein